MSNQNSNNETGVISFSDIFSAVLLIIMMLLVCKFICYAIAYNLEQRKQFKITEERIAFETLLVPIPAISDFFAKKDFIARMTQSGIESIECDGFSSNIAVHFKGNTEELGSKCKFLAIEPIESPSWGSGFSLKVTQNKLEFLSAIKIEKFEQDKMLAAFSEVIDRKVAQDKEKYARIEGWKKN